MNYAFYFHPLLNSNGYYEKLISMRGLIVNFTVLEGYVWRGGGAVGGYDFYVFSAFKVTYDIKIY